MNPNLSLINHMFHLTNKTRHNKIYGVICYSTLTLNFLKCIKLLLRMTTITPSRKH